jgi:hypothetical protein
VKFYPDEHIPKAVAEGLRRRGIESIFEMIIPGPNEKVRSGMEGKKE